MIGESWHLYTPHQTKKSNSTYYLSLNVKFLSQFLAETITLQEGKMCTLKDENSSYERNSSFELRDKFSENKL